jgi:hypothetical protein
VKNRDRRCGGEDVGCDVSALRSHCRTDILRGQGRNLDVYKGSLGQIEPDDTVKTTRSESKSLTDVLQKKITVDITLQCDLLDSMSNRHAGTYEYGHLAYLGQCQAQPKYIPLLSGSRPTILTRIQCPEGMQVRLGVNSRAPERGRSYPSVFAGFVCYAYGYSMTEEN